MTNPASEFPAQPVGLLKVGPEESSDGAGTGSGDQMGFSGL